MVINHLLTGMILQAKTDGQKEWYLLLGTEKSGESWFTTVWSGASKPVEKKIMG